MYRCLDIFFFAFHSAFIIFILFGWIWKATRKAHLIAVGLTAFSWFVLGIWYGFGYCPCTDWHWQVRLKLGQTDMPFSYVKFLIDSATGWDANATLVDTCTCIVFFVVSFISIYVNVTGHRRRERIMRLFVFAAIAFGCMSAMAAQETGGKENVLYNGITLPAVWPPNDRAPTREPMPVPYLDAVPSPIPIDMGRQLFVDDFLIETTTLRRTFHKAVYHPASPVLVPDKPWECETEHPSSMVFSDGVWYDPQDHLFKMWYMGGYCKTTCYATSNDGIHWEKPLLDVVPGTNIVHKAGRDSGTVWLDLMDKDPQRRFKMFLYLHPDQSEALTVFFSADGIHWGDPVGRSGPLGDRSTVFYNPFREVWVYSIRDYDSKGIGRFRRYGENPDVLKAAQWQKGEPPFWVGADTLDPLRPELNTPCELYNLDAVAYESILLGLFDIWRGQPKDRAKPNELCIGFSRDGFHWQRPTHEAFMGVSEHYGDWNWANVQSAGGGCLVVGDQLYFYASGRKGVTGTSGSGVCSTGLATLRRDGFASMDADGSEGVLTTRPVRFNGRHLFVNVDAPKGSLSVEILGTDNQPITPYTRENCIPIAVDKTCVPVRWKGKSDPSDLSDLSDRSDRSDRSDKPVRFRFHLQNGKLYAFWVSPETSGSSHGYVAAGGPGFNAPTDTVGSGK